MEATKQPIAALRTRMDQMYEDRLDGKTDDEFRARKMNEWREQERRLESELLRLKVEVTADSVFTVQSILELANRAHFLYLTRNHAEPGSIAETCPFELRYGWRNSLAFYRKPYDLISERVKNQEWSGREDLNLRPLVPNHETKNSKCFIWCRLGSSIPLFLSLICTDLVEKNNSAVC